ncbi:MAG: hypothetical protein LAN62_01290 [Acidobacteriia bacterium]|nr:hypothetical protein [Terriglobia bacterium]
MVGGRIWWVRGCALLGALLSPSFVLTVAAPQPDTQVFDLSSYVQADPITNHPIEKLRKDIPELKKLEPSDDQSSLPDILSRVAENLDLFLKDFVNTTSREEIDESRRGGGTGDPTELFPGVIRGDQTARFTHDFIHQRFRYLMLLEAGAPRRLAEYRTDIEGQDRSADLPVAGFLQTSGFASLLLLLDRDHQPLSSFRYLGSQVVNGRPTYVLAFAERPMPAAVVVSFRLSTGESIPVILQGVAWIDAETYQVVRMRTDLLAPQTDMGLRQESTIVQLHQVTFRQSPAVLWLPQEVEVTVEFRGTLFQNRHRYSDYQIFHVDTEQHVQPPKEASAPPQK